MSIIQSGDTGSTAGAGEDNGESSRVSYTIGYTVIYADSQEELDEFLRYLSLLTGKPVSEISESDLYTVAGMGRTSDGDSSNETSWMLDVSKDQSWKASADAMNNQEFFGKELPGYSDADALFLDNEASPDDTGATRSANTAGYQGAAQGMYDSNYPATDGVSNPHGLEPITEKDVSPEVWALLQFLFGADTQFDTGHLNVLKMMGLATGGNDPSTWALTTQGSERGYGEEPLLSGTELLAAFKGNQTDPDAVTFVPGSSMFGFSQADMDATQLALDATFNSDGSFAVDPVTGVAKTSEDVKALANETVGRMGDGEPIEYDLAGAPPEVLELLNFLYGKPAGNTVFTDAEINAASALGLIKQDAKGGWAITATGLTTVNGIGEASPEETTPDTEDPATQQAAYNAEVGAISEPDKYGGDRYYSPEELAARGIPLAAAQWIFEHFGADDGGRMCVSEDVLNRLIDGGYLIQPGRDGTGRGGDYYVFTAKGIDLICRDPSLSPAEAKALYIQLHACLQAYLEGARGKDIYTRAQELVNSTEPYFGDQTFSEYYGNEYDQKYGADPAADDSKAEEPEEATA